MSRFPKATGNEKTKTFKVKEGYVVGHPDNSGRSLKGGQEIELTKKQADHLNKLGALDLDLDFDEDGDDTTKQSGGASDPSSPPSDNKTQESPGDKAKGSGNKAL